MEQKCGSTEWEFGPKPGPPCQRPAGHPTWAQDGVGHSIYPDALIPVSKAAAAQEIMERKHIRMAQETRKVVGLSLVLMTDPKVTGTEQITEEMARSNFKTRYGFEATNTTWLYEAAYSYYDPATFGQVVMPQRWMLLVEGMVPEEGTG